jgi:hypothetical protein
VDDVLIPYQECALVRAKWRNDERAALGEVKAGLDGGGWEVSFVCTASATLLKTGAAKHDENILLSYCEGKLGWGVGGGGNIAVSAICEPLF